MGDSTTPLMTVSDVARSLSVSRSLVYRWVEEKRIPCFRLGKTLRFSKPEIEKWLTVQHFEPPDATANNVEFERDVDKILKPTIMESKL